MKKFEKKIKIIILKIENNLKKRIKYNRIKKIKKKKLVRVMHSTRKEF